MRIRKRIGRWRYVREARADLRARVIRVRSGARVGAPASDVPNAMAGAFEEWRSRRLVRRLPWRLQLLAFRTLGRRYASRHVRHQLREQPDAA